MLKAARGATVTGEEGGAVAIGMFVHQAQGFAIGRHAAYAQHWSENLVAIDAHVFGDVVEQGRPQPIAIGGAVHCHASPIHQQARAFAHAGIDIASDLVAMCASDQWSHVDLARAVAGAQGRHAPRDGGEQCISHRRHRDLGRDRHAAFAGRAIGGVDGGVGGEFDIGVGQYHHVILGAAQRLHTFAMLRAGRINTLGDGG